MREYEHWLECQDCGDQIRQLNKTQAQMVADNPYNYITYCGPCKLDRKRLGIVEDF